MTPPRLPRALWICALVAMLAVLGACSDDNPGYSENNDPGPTMEPEPNPEPQPDPNPQPEPQPEPNPDPEPDPEPESLIGAPCTANGECGFGGFCVPDAQGFEDGYCVVGCNPNDPIPCDGDNPCVLLGENNLCVDGCDSNDDCRDGYGCIDPFGNGEAFCFIVECSDDDDCDGDQVCAPNGNCGNPDASSGDPCEDTGECLPGSFCIEEINDQGDPSGFRDGYCILGCETSDDCDGDNPCIELGDNSFCLQDCGTSDDCRDGYGCVDFGGDDLFCFPGNTDAVVGDVCLDNGDCEPGGFCVGEFDGQGQPSGFEDGYCTVLGCETDDDCSGDSYCADNGQGTFCVKRCETVDDCRPRYTCADFDGGKACLAGQCDDDSECDEGAQCINAFCGDPEAGLGDVCDANQECAPGQFCILPEGENTQGFDGGYCAEANCEPFMSGNCGDDGICIPVDQEGNGICLLACEADTDCREGGLYECRLLFDELDEALTACLPTECFDDTDCPDTFACEINTSTCLPTDP